MLLQNPKMKRTEAMRRAIAAMGLSYPSEESLIHRLMLKFGKRNEQLMAEARARTETRTVPRYGAHLEPTSLRHIREMFESPSARLAMEMLQSDGHRLKELIDTSAFRQHSELMKRIAETLPKPPVPPEYMRSALQPPPGMAAAMKAISTPVIPPGMASTIKAIEEHTRLLRGLNIPKIPNLPW